MKHRKLRIAWSVAWGVAAVLLVVLWIRSYIKIDRIAWRGAQNTITLMSLRGQLGTAWRHSSVAIPAERQRTERISGPAESAKIGYNDGTGRSLPSFLGFISNWVSAPGRPTSILVLPYRFLSLLTASLAVLPWASSLLGKRRYSLRTLLIATTLIAVGLGLIVWATK
jgi:hypothetical protein